MGRQGSSNAASGSRVVEGPVGAGAGFVGVGVVGGGNGAGGAGVAAAVIRRMAASITAGASAIPRWVRPLTTST